MAARDVAGNRATARRAGLHYVEPGEAGLTRVRRGRAFAYRDPHGRRLRDARTLERIRALVIPPAWTDVWICARADGHLQATGRDARGRKQHRYHASWIAARASEKYGRLIEFAAALPAIRRRVCADLHKPPLSRDRVLATVVTLLEKTLIRIGNQEYARANRSYGLTTLQDDHVEVRGGLVRFRFRGKSGVLQTIELDDAPLARMICQCRDVPGKALFQYLTSDGSRQSVDSAAVNEYLRSITGRSFTAKNFRTWAATVLAAQELCGMPACSSKAAFKRNAVRVIDAVAARLGNTRAVCRGSYVHPGVFEAYRAGRTIAGVRTTSSRTYLAPEEAATLGLLKSAARQRRESEAA